MTHKINNQMSNSPEQLRAKRTAKSIHDAAKEEKFWCDYTTKLFTNDFQKNYLFQ